MYKIVLSKFEDGSPAARARPLRASRVGPHHTECRGVRLGGPAYNYRYSLSSLQLLIIIIIISMIISIMIMVEVVAITKNQAAVGGQADLSA